MPVYPGARRITAKSHVNFSASVSVSGGTGEEAKTWEIGFTQTVLESKRTAVYVDDAKRECYLRVNEMTNLPALDVENSWKPNAPFRAFYTTAMNPISSNSSVAVAMTDTPLWASLARTKNRKGRLRHLTGKDRFCTWLIARHVPGIASVDKVGEIRYLAWVTWQVVYDTTVNLDFMLPEAGRAQMARLSAHGSGATPAPVKAVLTGLQNETDSWQAVVGGRKSPLPDAP
jgi:hypothetical protein